MPLDLLRTQPTAPLGGVDHSGLPHAGGNSLSPDESNQQKCNKINLAVQNQKSKDLQDFKDSLNENEMQKMDFEIYSKENI